MLHVSVPLWGLFNLTLNEGEKLELVDQLYTFPSPYGDYLI